jgi:hypothetical protein
MVRGCPLEFNSAAESQIQLTAHATHSFGIYRWPPYPPMKTTTSDPHLLPEIFDYIIDFLRDDMKTLKQCCLVSKSWLPRSREHIFADLTLDEEDDLESWRKTFSDPANSPSYHTRNLTIRCDPGHMEESGWVQSFPRLETLCMMSEDGWVNFPMFQKLAPSITALALCSLYLPHLQILDLICSLPLLEDLILIGEVNEAKGSSGPPAVESTSPPLNNHLDILLSEGFARTLSGLLSLPGGLRFRAVDLAWCREPDDLLQVRELVGACSGTLESLRIGSRVSGMPRPLLLWTSHSLKLRIRR